jgi:PAS domain S-box-containing protein
MRELTRIILENEMDLILAYKQTMRLAELAALPLSAQTVLATAVSEISRSAINKQNTAYLKLAVSDKTEKIKSIVAVLEDGRKNFDITNDDGYKYARRLVQNITGTSTGNGTQIELTYRLPATTKADESAIEQWSILLNHNPEVSPYEEIKRKNRQLVELTDKLRSSEQQYKTLTDSLPIIILSMAGDGNITYANSWLTQYTGESIEDLNSTKWRNVIHADDLNNLWQEWEQRSDNVPVIIPECRIKETATDEYKWHTGIFTPISSIGAATVSWSAFLVDINVQKEIEVALKDNQYLKNVQKDLEHKVTLLDQSNARLEQFAYIASHDLQEPLRKISLYSDYLKTNYGHKLPEEANLFLNNLVRSTVRMKSLIQDVLAYSTVKKDEFVKVDLNIILCETVEELEIGIDTKKIMLTTNRLPEILGNRRQLRQLFDNLISNSLKFARTDIVPEISVHAETTADEVVLSFSDNGIGFEDKYVSKMFDLFQRLHGGNKFTGTGIGLAICKKIVELHSGSITARGELGKGATFFITLPLLQN